MMTTKAAARTGFCVCGQPVVAHFDAHNGRVSCASLCASLDARVLRGDPLRQPVPACDPQPLCAQDAADQATPLGYWPIDIPVTLRDRDLMPIVRMKHSKFYTRKAAGDFRFLEVTPQLPNSHTLYSGHLVTKWLRGELRQDIPAPAAPSRFFRRAQAVASPKGRPGRPRKGHHSGPVLVHAPSLSGLEEAR